MGYADDLPRGQVFRVAHGFSTVLPDMDFETFSCAGFLWNEIVKKWGPVPGAAEKDKGLPAVGAAVYAEHETADAIVFGYNLKDGRGKCQWVPGMPNPQDLFDYLAAGGLIEAWNVSFEWWIWNKVMVRRYGWPPLPLSQCRCAMAKARAFCYPGKLDLAGKVINSPIQKDAAGKALIKKFTVPRNPTIKNKNLRLHMADAPEDAQKFYEYNLTDISAEAEISLRCPDLTPLQLSTWLADQAINRRGVQIDLEAVHNCIAVMNQAYAKYDAELVQLTGGMASSATKLADITEWLRTRGVYADSLAKDAAEELLKNTMLPPDCRRVLEIRMAAGSASVKKVFAMLRRTTKAGRMHDMYTWNGARTGRTTGAGEDGPTAQAQNLPNSGPEVRQCGCATCTQYYAATLRYCPHCGISDDFSEKKEWCIGAVEEALQVMRYRSLEYLERVFVDPLAVIAGVLRSLFVAGPGKDLICSDYSAIEAVVLAVLAGEQWRIDVFNTHGKIYESSAAMITGKTLQFYLDYKKQTGQHHPDRKKLGKIAELASGYRGWVNAWLNFGGGDYFTEAEIKKHILAWRAASPAIVEFWGGQFRGLPWEADYRPEMHGMEGCAISAVIDPGSAYQYRGLAWQMDKEADVLYCLLPSGRHLIYHTPRLRTNEDPRRDLVLSYWGYNTNIKNGPVGWICMDTHGGKIVENIVQAVSYDIFSHAIVNLEKAGYPVVMHTHDEPTSEIPEGWGSIEEFEMIVNTLPAWAQGWPVKARDGWRGKRYRK